jgi:hypothetical protein
MNDSKPTIVSEYRLQPVGTDMDRSRGLEMLVGEHLASQTQVRVFKKHLKGKDGRAQQLEEMIGNGTVFAMDAWAEEKGDGSFF